MTDDPLWLRFIKLAVGDCGCFFSTCVAFFIFLLILGRMWLEVEKWWKRRKDRGDKTEVNK